MKRNFDAAILDLDGAPIRPGMSAKAMELALKEIWPKLSEKQRKEFDAAVGRHAGEVLTLRDVCVSALISAYPDERELKDTVRMERMELARRLHKGGLQEVTPADRDLVKPLISKRFPGVLVPVVAAEMLEAEVAAPKRRKR